MNVTGRSETWARVDHAIAKLADLGPGWDSYGADVVSPSAMREARNIVEALDAYGQLDGFEPAVVPGVGGQVQLEWHREGLDLELEFEPDGRCFYLLSGQGDDREGEIAMARVVTLVQGFRHAVATRIAEREQAASRTYSRWLGRWTGGAMVLTALCGCVLRDWPLAIALVVMMAGWAAGAWLRLPK